LASISLAEILWAQGLILETRHLLKSLATRADSENGGLEAEAWPVQMLLFESTLTGAELIKRA
jgi:hypothetical protein